MYFIVVCNVVHVVVLGCGFVFVVVYGVYFRGRMCTCLPSYSFLVGGIGMEFWFLFPKSLSFCVGVY